jgi:truncated hemoglobin YjbI
MELRKLNSHPRDYPQFEALGGKEMLKKVSKIFYDKIYEHEWIGQFFKEVDQEIIENQQVDFMTSALGGPKVYCGRLPIPTHKNMYITPELFDLRQSLLKDSLIEAKASEELIEKWLKIDEAFKSGLVKNNMGECEKRFFTDEILVFPNPMKKAS